MFTGVTFGKVDDRDRFMRVMLDTMGHLITAKMLGVLPENLITGDSHGPH